jgi:serine/threonine-protein kinase RsbW
MTSTIGTRSPRLLRQGHADGSTAAEFRTLVEEWVAGLSTLSCERRADIVLAADEALSNCAEHAYRNRHGSGRMTVEASHDGESMTIRVEDDGEWIEPVPQPLGAPRGRGLKLMHALADAVEIDAGPSGTTVSMRFDGVAS